METKMKKQSTSEKLSAFVTKKRSVLLVALVVVVVAIVTFVVATAVLSKVRSAGLTAVDEITFALTNESTYLEENELEARREIAITALEKYLKNGGVVGVRANMLAADIEFQQKNYDKALAFWQAAAKKGRTSYTTPLAYFNSGICFEELGDLESAAKYYTKAAEVKEFAFAPHARFSAGRVKEALEDFAGANSEYQTLIDAVPDDSWAQLAKSRQIALRVEGKIE